MLRRALDKNDWKEIDEAMEYNRKWGAFSIFCCKGHLFRKRCVITEQEWKVVHKHITY
jgi:hypothetical protein